MQPTEKVKDKVALDLVVTKSKVMAAGPLLHIEGSLPSRVGLMDRGYEFSVHLEIFDVPRSEDVFETCEKSESSTIDGYYYKPEELDKAIERFANRVIEHANRNKTPA